MLDELEHGRLRPLEIVDDEDERRVLRASLEQRPRRELRLGRRGADCLGRRDPDLRQDLDEGPVRDALAVGEHTRVRDVCRAVDVLEEVSDESRLPDSGRADQREEPARPRLDDVGEIGAQTLTLAHTSDHRALEPSCNTGSRRIQHVQAMRPHEALALQLELDRLRLDGVAHERERVRAEQDIARPGRLLEPRGHVHCVPRHERVALTRHHRARIHADPRVQTELVDDVAQLDRGANRAQGVVLPRNRNPEDGHHRVTDELLHRPPMTLQHHPRRLVVPVHQGPQRLRVRAVTDRRRACQVAEEDRHDLSYLTLGRRPERSTAARAKSEPARTLATAPGADDHREESMPGQRRLSAAHVDPSRDGQTRHVGLAESTPCRLARLGGTVPGEPAGERWPRSTAAAGVLA